MRVEGHDIPRRKRFRIGGFAIYAIPMATLLVGGIQGMPKGPVVGSGQDLFYNVVRSLRALHDGLNPHYFIHPALFYELLGGVYGAIGIAGRALHVGILDVASLGELFVRSPELFLVVGRSVALLFSIGAVGFAVAIGAFLGGGWVGLSSGLLLATLGLFNRYSTMLRVDSLSVFMSLAAVYAILRFGRSKRAEGLIVAAVLIGVAASADYPNALLLLPLAGLLVGKSPDLPAGWTKARCVMAIVAAAGGTFLVLNPYVVLDGWLFAHWFWFQLSTVAATHPHAASPRAGYYVDLIKDQGLLWATFSTAGVLGVLRGEKAVRWLTVWAVVYIGAFSLSRSQYDRFIMVPLAVLMVLGTSAPLLRSRIVAVAAAILAVVTYGMGIARDRQGNDVRLRVANAGRDIRTEAFEWMMTRLPRGATLLYESDSLPLMQVATDEGFEGRFQRDVQDAISKRFPSAYLEVRKAQYVGGVLNYDLALLGERGYVLISSRNREYIGNNREEYRKVEGFYHELSERGRIVKRWESGDENLVLCEVTGLGPGGHGIDQSRAAGIGKGR